ncbi:MAG: helix-turn-helix domain-containing protein, partial [Planctomycetota bacterium]
MSKHRPRAKAGSTGLVEAELFDFFVERRAVDVEANGWNRQETARQLDINRTTLYKKIKQFGLDEPG